MFVAPKLRDGGIISAYVRAFERGGRKRAGLSEGDGAKDAQPLRAF